MGPFRLLQAREATVLRERQRPGITYSWLQFLPHVLAASSAA